MSHGLALLREVFPSPEWDSNTWKADGDDEADRWYAVVQCGGLKIVESHPKSEELACERLLMWWDEATRTATRQHFPKVTRG